MTKGTKTVISIVYPGVHNLKLFCDIYFYLENLKMFEKGERTDLDGYLAYNINVHVESIIIKYLI